MHPPRSAEKIVSIPIFNIPRPPEQRTVGKKAIRAAFCEISDVTYWLPGSSRTELYKRLITQIVNLNLFQ